MPTQSLMPWLPARVELALCSFQLDPGAMYPLTRTDDFHVMRSIARVNASRLRARVRSRDQRRANSKASYATEPIDVSDADVSLLPAAAAGFAVASTDIR